MDELYFQHNPVDKAGDELRSELDKKAIDKNKYLELFIGRQKEKIKQLWSPDMERSSKKQKSILSSILNCSFEFDIPYQDIFNWIYGKDEKGNSKLLMDENLHILYDQKPGVNSLYKKSSYLNLLVTDVDKFKIMISERKKDQKYVLNYEHHKPIGSGWMPATFYGFGSNEVFNTFDEAHEAMLSRIKAARDKRERYIKARKK